MSTFFAAEEHLRELPMHPLVYMLIAAALFALALLATLSFRNSWRKYDPASVHHTEKPHAQVGHETRTQIDSH